MKNTITDMRDHFAAEAMQGFIVGEAMLEKSETADEWLKSIADASYEMADAMMKARAEQKQWVGLTDEETMALAAKAGFSIYEDYDEEREEYKDKLHWWSEDGEKGDDELYKLRDLIEAKLKEKNA